MAINGRQLRTWIVIAKHLNVSIDTAQRWALRYDLPVRKCPGVNGTVIADLHLLDQWIDRNIRPVRIANHA